MADFCSECGGFTGGKPRVEFERDPAIRAWHVFIVSIGRDGNERGMRITIPDRINVEWIVGRPQELCESTEIAR